MRSNSKMQLPTLAWILRLTCYTTRGSRLDPEKDVCYSAACSHTVHLKLTRSQTLILDSMKCVKLRVRNHNSEMNKTDNVRIT